MRISLVTSVRDIPRITNQINNKKMNILNKIKSVKLCLMAHPDNEIDSEFADRISDLEEIEKELSQDNWTKIENEDYLPEQGGVYHIVVNGKLSKGTYLKNNRWYVAGNDYPKTTELHGITHYHKIITPDLPTI